MLHSVWSLSARDPSMVAANCDLMAAMSAALGGPVTCAGVSTQVACVQGQGGGGCIQVGAYTGGGEGEGEGAALGGPVTCGVKVREV